MVSDELERCQSADCHQMWHTKKNYSLRNGRPTTLLRLKTFKTHLEHALKTKKAKETSKK